MLHVCWTWYPCWCCSTCVCLLHWDSPLWDLHWLNVFIQVFTYIMHLNYLYSHSFNIFIKYKYMYDNIWVTCIYIFTWLIGCKADERYGSSLHKCFLSLNKVAIPLGKECGRLQFTTQDPVLEYRKPEASKVNSRFQTVVVKKTYVSALRLWHETQWNHVKTSQRCL